MTIRHGGAAKILRKPEVFGNTVEGGRVSDIGRSNAACSAEFGGTKIGGLSVVVLAAKFAAIVVALRFADRS